MKEGWEIKKLGEVAAIHSGKAIASQDILPNRVNNSYPCYGGNGIRGYVMTNNGSGQCPIIGRVGALCGNVQLTNGPFYATEHALVANIKDTRVSSEWLFVVLKSMHLRQYAKGVAQPVISASEISKLSIPVPPLAEQQRIVAELDCINGIIEKKKEQLKELDTLAQSIFYDMFGDPITNEKGWEVKKLKEVSTLLNGRAYQQSELLDKGKYKVLRVGNFFTNSSYYYSDLELDEDKYCDNGDLLFAWSASFGAFIWSGGKVIYHYHIWKVLFDEKQLNIEYYRCLLNRMTSFFMKDVHGIGMVHLTKVGMEQYDLPLPPLSLQQSFAAKVEAIEKQKSLIKQSIGEAETLLASRMDYYFN